MNRLIIASLFVFLTGCSQYMMSDVLIQPGDSRGDVTAAWGEPFKINRSRANGVLQEVYVYGQNTDFYGSANPYNTQDTSTRVVIRNGVVAYIEGYKAR